MLFFPLTSQFQAPALMLGTANFGSSIPEKTAFSLMDRYTEAGGTLLDSAHVYGRWIPGAGSLSEEVIGRWFRSRRRDKLRIATKGAHPVITPEGLGPMRLAPSDILQDCEESLQHLGTDRIDFYYLHRDDVTRPVEEILYTLETLKKQGKILGYGASNWTLERLTEAKACAGMHGWSGFAAVENQYSLGLLNPGAPADRTLVVTGDPDIPQYQALGLLPVAYSSQALGYFTKLSQSGPEGLPSGTRLSYDNPANRERLRILESLSAETHLTVSQLVLGFLSGRGTAAVIGCRTLEQLNDSMTASDVALTDSQIDRLLNIVF